MDFSKFLSRLDEMSDETNNDVDMGVGGGAGKPAGGPKPEGGKGGTNAFETITSSSGKWGYIPEKDYMNGLLKPVIVEDSDEKWTILYCAPGGRGAKKASVDFDEAKAISYIGRILNEAIEDWGGAPKESLKGWTVMSQWSGSFEECLKKCVAIVTNKPGEDPNISKFQAMVR